MLFAATAPHGGESCKQQIKGFMN